MRGGYGDSACPFPGKQWNAETGGNFLKLGTPIGVGGTPPYPGNASPAPQTTQPLVGGKGSGNVSSTYSWIPQPIVNSSRFATNTLANGYRQYQGLEPNPDPRPFVQNQTQY